MPIQESLALRLGVRIVIKHMERIELGVFGIDTISGKTAAQTVAAVVHDRDGANDLVAVDALAVFGKNAGDGAAGRDPHLPFF